MGSNGKMRSNEGGGAYSIDVARARVKYAILE